MENQERIDAYIRGEMSPEECSDFERDLGRDADLVREYAMVRKLVEALRVREEMLRCMAKWKNPEYRPYEEDASAFMCCEVGNSCEEDSEGVACGIAPEEETRRPRKNKKWKDSIGMLLEILKKLGGKK